jgi:shikimate dehydrogenase
MSRPLPATVCASISSPDLSVAPLMYNAAFRKLGLNFVYVSFDVSDLGAAVGGMRALNIRGYSVSRPFKESALPFLDEIHPTAKAIGAVNIISNEGGRLVGYNSDWLGAVKPLANVTSFAGRRAAVVGAGGAARAIAYGLKVNGARVYLYNRTSARLRRVAEELGVNVGGGLDALGELRGADIVVNATPEAAIVPGEVLRAGQTVLDAVFYPLDTKLIVAARAAGCSVIRGVEMLVHQGAVAFELFTGRAAPVETMFESLLTALKT